MSWKSVQRVLKTTGPSIMAVAGCFGVVGTALLSARASLQLRVDDVNERTICEKIRICAPAMICGGITIACILASDSLHRKARRALSSAYGAALLAGQQTDICRKMREDLPVSEAPEESQFYDDFSGMWFNALTSDVLHTEDEINERLSQDGWVLLSDVYEMLGIDIASLSFDSSRIGWSTNNEHADLWVDHFGFEFYPVTTEEIDGHIISFETPPVPILD